MNQDLARLVRHRRLHTRTPSNQREEVALAPHTHCAVGKEIVLPSCTLFSRTCEHIFPSMTRTHAHMLIDARARVCALDVAWVL